MRRELSAGGVVVRRLRGDWHVAAIRPGGKTVWALPKGLIAPGENPAAHDDGGGRGQGHDGAGDEQAWAGGP